jgi:hypothetical protein
MVIKGKPVFDRPNLFELCLSQYEGKECKIIIEPITPSSTDKQRGFVYVIAKKMMEHDAFIDKSQKDIIDFFVSMFLSSYVTIKDKTCSVVPDFEHLNIAQMSKLIDGMLSFGAAELGIKIDR